MRRICVRVTGVDHHRIDRGQVLWQERPLSSNLHGLSRTFADPNRSNNRSIVDANNNHSVGRHPTLPPRSHQKMQPLNQNRIISLASIFSFPWHLQPHPKSGGASESKQ